MTAIKKGGSPFLYDSSGRVVGTYTDDGGETFFSRVEGSHPGVELVAFDSAGNVVPVTLSAGLTFSSGELSAMSDATAALQTEGNEQLQQLNNTFQPILFDAAGRLRVGTPHTLFDGKTLGADLTQIWSTEGTGTGAFDNNTFNMSVTSGQYLVRQSRQYLHYFSGKSQTLEWTFDNFVIEAGVEKGFGYISSSHVAPYTATYDGFAVVSTGTTYELRVYNAGTLTTVPWTSWDAYSEISSYDFSKFTIFSADLLWLGGSEIRLFMKLPTGWKLVHTYAHAGLRSGVIFKSPNQPMRYWIRGLSGAGSFRAVCSQASTEGTTDSHGSSSALISTSTIAANSTSTTYALLGIRKTDAFRDIAVRILDLTVGQIGQNEAGVLMLLRNPTLSAALTYSADGRVETAKATTQTVTALGDVISAKAGVNGSVSATGTTDYSMYLGSTVAGVHDEYVVASAR